MTKYNIFVLFVYSGSLYLYTCIKVIACDSSFMQKYRVYKENIKFQMQVASL